MHGCLTHGLLARMSNDSSSQISINVVSPVVRAKQNCHYSYILYTNAGAIYGLCP